MTFQQLYRESRSSNFEVLDEGYKSALAAGALGLAAGFGMNKGEKPYDIHKDPQMQYHSETQPNNDTFYGIDDIKDVVDKSGFFLTPFEKEQIIKNYMKTSEIHNTLPSSSDDHNFMISLQRITFDYAKGNLSKAEYNKKINYIRSAMLNYQSAEDMKLYR